MDLIKILSICVFCATIGVGLVFCVPTFGSEFVRIKVHIPHDSSKTKDLFKYSLPMKYNRTKNYKNYRVIHYYHRQRKPNKKFPVDATAVRDVMQSGTKGDNSNTAENPAETYRGYDSYRAAHVQGLGSGAYYPG